MKFNEIVEVRRRPLQFIRFLAQMQLLAFGKIHKYIPRSDKEYTACGVDKWYLKIKVISKKKSAVKSA